MKSIISRATLLSVTALSLLATAWAGSLTPPGAPAPTMKTLDEVEARTPIHEVDLPLTISQPGSYYLAEYIQHTGNINCITITAGNVTLDLNGFTLDGSDAGGTAIGILAIANQTTGTVVKNGAVTGWPDNGIRLLSPESRVEKVDALENGANGIVILTGSVIDCAANFNAQSGIVTTGDLVVKAQSIVSGCKTANNGDFGILMGASGLVKNNASSGNSQNGILLNDPNCTATNNNCSRNGADGIAASVAPNAVINGNNCSENDLHGISLNNDSVNSTVKDNNCSQNGSTGIAALSAANAVINGNSCSANDSHGISLSSAINATVKGNNCSANGSDGIFASSISSGCTMRDNDSSGNGSEGIRSEGPECRLIGNNVGNNVSIGLVVTGASSIVLKNTAEGNSTAYAFVATVRYGPVIVLSAGGAITSEHPWANFEY